MGPDGIVYEGRTYCAHLVDLSEHCPACADEWGRREDHRRVSSRGESQGDGRGCAACLLLYLMVASVIGALVLALADDLVAVL